MFSFFSCESLNVNVFHRFMCSNPWSPVGDTVWEGLKGVCGLAGGSMLPGKAFEVSKLHGGSQHSAPSGMSTFPAVVEMDSYPSGTVSPNKPFLL